MAPKGLKLAYEVAGPKVTDSDYAGTVIFLHGWPDNAHMWRPQLEGFSKQGFRCVAIHSVNALGPKAPAGTTATWGVNFEEMIDLIHDVVLDKEVSGGKQVDVIGHDWGAMHAYLYEQKYPQFVRRLITLDIGVKVKPTAAQAVAILMYQGMAILSILCYNLIPFVGEAIGNAIFRFNIYNFVKAPKGLRGEHQTAAICFPYIHFMLFHLLKPFTKTKTGLMRSIGYRPSCPTMFIRGKKSFPFYTKSWITWLKETPGCEYKVYPSGHWICFDCPDEFEKDATAFLKQKPAAKAV